MDGSSSQPLAVDIQKLTKSFGNHLALKGLDLKVRKGDFLTIVGPNGAGKTTLIKVLATTMRPSSGSVQVAGFYLKENPVQVRCNIGIVSHHPFLYDDLTSFENLKFYGRMYDVPDLEERIHTVATRFELIPRLHHQVRTLSRGLRQRLSIARAVIHNPRIMLLNEPESGLDQHATAMLQETLDAVSAEEGTIIMTTHSLEYGLKVGNRVAILTGGKIAYEESTQALNLDNLRETYYRYTGTRR